MTLGRASALAGIMVMVVALSLSAAAPAVAEDDVSCRAASGYQGTPLHAAITLPELQGPISGTLDAATIDRLTQALTLAQRATAAPSITAAVAIPGKGLWTIELASPPSAPSSAASNAIAATSAAASAVAASATTGAPLHFWASAGKTLVAVVILQLADEGKLRLDDPVSRWIEKVPNGDAITIEHLLAHTSGLFSANEDKKVHDARRYFTPAENLAVARKRGALFCPGARWRYSNTGYDLLGEIIARVDGRPFPAAITARIITPLGLTRLRVLTPGDPPRNVAPLSSAKEPPIDPSWAGAAGAIVGSSDDMLRVWHALLTNRLLKPETTRRMFARLYPMFTPVEFYGLGVMLFDVPDADGTTRQWLGHAGGTPGAGAVVAYSPSDNAFVAVALTGDGSAQATANLLLQHLRGAAAK
jgi:D-alanyl-D-alanine carboxypeptidase